MSFLVDFGSCFFWEWFCMHLMFCCVLMIRDTSIHYLYASMSRNGHNLEKYPHHRVLALDAPMTL